MQNDVKSVLNYIIIIFCNKFSQEQKVATFSKFKLASRGQFFKSFNASARHYYVSVKCLKIVIALKNYYAQ